MTYHLPAIPLLPFSLGCATAVYRSATCLYAQQFELGDRCCRPDVLQLEGGVEIGRDFVAVVGFRQVVPVPRPAGSA